MMRLSVPTLVLVLALAAMAGPAAAADGAVRVGSVVYDGDASEEGGLDLLFIRNNPESAATPWISGSAASVRGIEYTFTSRSVHLPSVPGLPPLPVGSQSTPEDEQPRIDATHTAASFRLAAAQPAFELHAFGLDGSVAYDASSDERTLEQRPHLTLSPGAMAEPGTSVGTTQALEDTPVFATVDRVGPFVLHSGAPSYTQLTLRGDFILEIYGLTLDLVAAEGPRTLASGEWETPVADGSPVYDVKDSFVRLFLDDAEVTVSVDGGSPIVDYATGAVDMLPADTITLYDSYGTLAGTKLEGARYQLPAGNLLTIVPTDDALDVQVTDARLGTRGTIADVPAPASAALVGSGAVLALLVAVGIGLLRRVLRLPQLAEVELAIEEGEYRRAARMAARIVARRPSDESAVLARAIALSKAGEQQRTVSELSAHLAQAPASDGSLHYVLGLAQLDLGQKDAARVSLREAVRLTPSLSAEVGSRLGKAFSPPLPTTKETSVYA